MVFYIIDVYCVSFYIDTYFVINYALIYSSKFWQHLNHGQEKRSNRQNPGPSERTSQDQNFANNQLKGTVTTSFDAKLSDINKFVKRVQLHHWYIRLITSTADGSRTSLRAWCHTSGRGLTISNVTSPRLNWIIRIVRKARLWKKWAHKSFRSKLMNCTLDLHSRFVFTSCVQVTCFIDYM